MTRYIYGALMLVFISGCASHKFSTSPEYMNNEDYKNRTTLKTSLFSGATPMSDQQTQKLLTSKVTFPKKPKLVIIRLSPNQFSYDNYYRGEQSFNSRAFSLNESLTTGFLKGLVDSKKFTDVSLLPNFMINNENNFEVLRTVALRSQADLALITRTETFTDWQFNFSSSNQAKALATVESIILDTRTGIVPFSSIASEVVTEDKKTEDYSMNDTMNRAKALAEGTALKKTTDDLIKFLNAIN